jgi:dihydroxyacetone kinase-like protein
VVDQVLDVDWAISWIETVAQDVSERRDEISELDRLIGDGDHGENLARGFEAALAALSTGERPDTIGQVLRTVASALMSTVGGASGPLYGTAFLRAAKACPRPSIGSPEVVGLIEAALEGVTVRGRAAVGEKTMVDAWAPAVVAARDAEKGGESPAGVLDAAALAAQAGADATVPMQATKGRASYLGERSKGHRDPGAESTALILEAAARAAAA